MGNALNAFDNFEISSFNVNETFEIDQHLNCNKTNGFVMCKCMPLSTARTSCTPMRIAHANMSRHERWRLSKSCQT